MSAPAAEHFVIDTHREGTTEIVAIRGGVDINTAPLLRAVLDTVVRRRPRRVEVDLSAASHFGAGAGRTGRDPAPAGRPRGAAGAVRPEPDRPPAAGPDRSGARHRGRRLGHPNRRVSLGSTAPDATGREVRMAAGRLHRTELGITTAFRRPHMELI